MIVREAFFSDCLSYRYFLSIKWTPHATPRMMVWIMLNPSTANELENDPTITRCERRARELGYSGLVILNLFALRATNPNDMKSHLMPIGDETNRLITKMARRHRKVYCGWGAHGKHLKRSDEVVTLIKKQGAKMFALDTNKDGSPVHPLYQPYDKQFKEFQADYGGQE